MRAIPRFVRKPVFLLIVGAGLILTLSVGCSSHRHHRHSYCEPDYGYRSHHRSSYRTYHRAHYDGPRYSHRRSSYRYDCD